MLIILLDRFAEMLIWMAERIYNKQSKVGDQMDRNADALSDNLQSGLRLRSQVPEPPNQPYIHSRRSSLYPVRSINDGHSLMDSNFNQRERQRARKEAQAQQPIRQNQREQKQQQVEKIQGGQQCQVCFNYYRKRQSNQFGGCGHKYCQPCLTQHIYSSINNYKMVTCLKEDCRQTLDITSPHIRALALPLQQKYYKIMVLLNVAKDEDIRLCPTENCEGFIIMSQEQLQCPICGISFCKLCLLPRHSGNCDQNGVMIFQDKYEYKRCSKCKMVLEKKEGCNHMTCLCGHQFCYRCGKQWQEDHYCQPKASSNPQQLSHSLSRQQPLPLSQPLPVQALSRPLPQSQPPLAQPQSSSDLIRNNNLQFEINQHQQRTQPQPKATAVSQLNAVQSPNQNQSSSCPISVLKLLILAIIHITSAQIVITVFFCICAPVLLTVGFLVYSLGAGMKEMVQQSSCLKMVLMNIFLYLYHVGLFFCRKYPEYVSDWYCRDVMTLKVLFPMSYMIYQECMM